MTHVDWHALQRADENAHGNHPDDGEGGSHHLTKASKANSNAKPDAPQPTTTAAAAASVGLKAATAVLPLSTRRKDAIYGWEMAPCPQDPFLAFERDVKKAGLKTWRRIRAAEEGENDADHDGGDATDEGRAALLGVWRDAVIEINYRRVTKVIKSCRLDREELALWRWWFGVRDDDSVARERGEQELFERERELQGGSSVGGGGGGRRASTLTFKSVEMGREKADEVRAPNAGGRFDAKGWKDGVDPRPAMEDVWDLVEARVRRGSHSIFYTARQRADTIDRNPPAARRAPPPVRISTLKNQSPRSSPHAAPCQTRSSPLPILRSFATYPARRPVATARE